MAELNRLVLADDILELVQVLKKNFVPDSIHVLGSIQQSIGNMALMNGHVFVDNWPDFDVVVFENHKYTLAPETILPPVTIFAKCSREKLKDIIQGSYLQRLCRNQSEFQGIDEKCSEIVKEVGATFGFHRKSSVRDLICSVLTDFKDLVKCECPSGYRVATLKAEHAEFINSVWMMNRNKKYAHRFLARVECCIEQSLTAGMYTVATNELVAWTMVTEYGAIGRLHTLESHRRKGLAKFLISHLACELIKKDMTPYCVIDESNTASKNVFQKVGFTLFPQSSFNWVTMEPM